MGHVGYAAFRPNFLRPNLNHHDVFISYAQLDKPIADAVCAKLESRHIRCWIAPRNVPPGKNFPEAIIDAIEESKVVTLIFSSHANNSPHVPREVTKAVNKGCIIVPFPGFRRKESCLPNRWSIISVSRTGWTRLRLRLRNILMNWLVTLNEFFCRQNNLQSAHPAKHPSRETPFSVRTAGSGDGDGALSGNAATTTRLHTASTAARRACRTTGPIERGARASIDGFTSGTPVT